MRAEFAAVSLGPETREKSRFLHEGAPWISEWVRSFQTTFYHTERETRLDPCPESVANSGLPMIELTSAIAIFEASGPRLGGDSAQPISNGGWTLSPPRKFREAVTMQR
jgi:hypothetical protein